ncbi:protein SRG1-like [Diospyros lotus]|uniref:protein SRG1-like n=1 Tax=Diospyros lotus TaxID=55363 RepID=UPI002252AE18|nr:protein SRG1-like [Diospyros lotus]
MAFELRFGGDLRLRNLDFGGLGRFRNLGLGNGPLLRTPSFGSAGHLRTLEFEGSSLKVPCVQELAKEPLTTLPLRYIRSDQDPPAVSGVCSSAQVPVIDLQRLVLGEDNPVSELEKRKVTMVFGTDHHVSPLQLDLGNRTSDLVMSDLDDRICKTTKCSSLVEKVKVENIEEFFNLPMEEKKRFWQEPGDVQGFGKAFVVSEEQKLDWADLFYMVTLPTHLRKPHLLPKLPRLFRETMEAYSAEIKTLAMKILGFMAKPLKMKDGEMDDLFGEGMQSMRMTYYPPCLSRTYTQGRHCLSPHSDAIGLTILLQVNEMDGLQIKKDGLWIPIKPVAGAFIVNIGDMLEIVTNGIYRSVEHRAIVNSEKKRLSIATFHNTEFDGDLSPARSLVTPETSAVFKTMTTANFFKGLLTRELRDKSYLNVVRILTRH